MKKDELWEVYCKRNPAFREEDKTVEIKVAQLKRLFDQTYDQAVIETRDRTPTIHTHPFGDIFK